MNIELPEHIERGVSELDDNAKATLQKSIKTVLSFVLGVRDGSAYCWQKAVEEAAGAAIDCRLGKKQ